MNLPFTESKFWNIPKFILISFLYIFSSFQLLAIIINQESFFFGVKLGGDVALTHLSSNMILGFASAILLHRYIRLGSILSIILFGYSLVSVQYINNSDGVMIPTLWWSSAIILGIFVLCRRK